MNSPKILLSLSIVCAIFACTPAPANERSTKKELKISDVDSISVGNQLQDSTALTMVEEDLKTFVMKWNKAESIGLCKYAPEHWITVYLKDGTQRTFRQNGETIKEKNDECFNMGPISDYKGMYR